MTGIEGGTSVLVGRAEELAVVERLLTGAGAGRSGVLVVRGEAGIGKTALLDAAVAAAGDGPRVLRGTGTEFESALPYSGLHLLLRPVLGRIDALPGAQAGALRTALGMGEAAPSGGDRFLVGLAVLTLLAELAEERTLFCVLDDAQWLDLASAEALVFAARRLHAERIAVLFGVRDPHAPGFRPDGFDELRLRRLDTAAAGDLLTLYAADLRHHERQRIQREAEGNPLALLELTTARREGHGLSYDGPHGRIEQGFAARIGALPEASGTLLLVAAAADEGDAGTVFEAAGLLGAGVTDLAPAEAQGLVRLDGGRLVFRHPLIRSAAYRSGPAARRLAAHRALADAGGGHRAAWHRAQAQAAPDEGVAAELERSGEQVRARGGHAALATVYERAAALSPRPAERARRLGSAARAALDAGQLDRAGELAEAARREQGGDARARARVAEIAAEVANEQGDLSRAHVLLLDAALPIAAAEPQDAGRMLFLAVGSAWVAGDPVAAAGAAAAAAELELPGGSAIQALARVSSPDAGVRTAALRALREASSGPSGDLREGLRAACWNGLLGDHRVAYERAGAVERECRAQGAVGLLPRALLEVAQAQLRLGLHRDALAGGTEGLRIASDTGQTRTRAQLAAALAQLAAARGDEAWFQELGALADAVDLPDVRHLRTSAAILLDLGLGRFEAAADRAAAAPAGSACTCCGRDADEVEAALRAGRPEQARKAFARLAELAGHLDGPGIHAVRARCEGLLAGGSAAGGGSPAPGGEPAAGPDPEERFRRALELHSVRDTDRFEEARTGLLYGEWLRRNRRPVDSRGPLRAAQEAFERLGARPWAERAAAELRASGESRPGPETESPTDRLTPQELQVARLAAAGLTNRDIGSQLFLSPRTVGYHLYNAYPKLGVSSRVELARLDLAT
ncbi:LuxR family transcriptional regulator [Streptomyces sp. Isolate_45]|uniref:helix-turn-helix transcriptional regulator n=1 Tax=Streptomyces sp. Isolate_45 TaxID=2950111 RepID=UPI002481A7D9|nr:LuxR family transcriptional regulator [Streptomyces sp. Isolate_45]MDA5283836.1 LuxR family transcriptional regulator [Streptomyces sp. Isolate_45]